MTYDAYQSYQSVNLNAQTAQASPVQLVIVLMDGLLDELARARGHVIALRYELKAKSLDKCVAIINGLASALETDAGGEVVQNLARLYEFCAERLYRAGVDLNAALIDEVSTLIQTLKAGWVAVQAQERA
jgi:flagellar protein FliS